MALDFTVKDVIHRITAHVLKVVREMKSEFHLTAQA
jgi:hypothetical protein